MSIAIYGAIATAIAPYMAIAIYGAMAIAIAPYMAIYADI